MKKAKTQSESPPAGQHLKKLVRLSSFGGLFFSLLGTALIWAGTDSFGCSEIIWKASLASNIAIFFINWISYIPYRHSDQLVGNGVLTIFVLFNIFWLVGFSTFYFYFLFAKINIWLSLTALTIVTTLLIYHANLIKIDIKKAFNNDKNLFSLMYFEESEKFTFKREAIFLLEKSRKNRNPFKSIHMYAAIIVAPFVLVLNRVLTPIFGDGHGVFIVLAFFSVPLLLWGVELFVQTIMTMIYYPLKLQRETGKPVLLKDW